MTVEVQSVEECVLVSVNGTVIELSTRGAFNLVTELLVHIDHARAYGEVQRGEVANPKSNGNIRGHNRRKRD